MTFPDVVAADVDVVAAGDTQMSRYYSAIAGLYIITANSFFLFLKICVEEK